jgi:hypothetical protein
MMETMTLTEFLLARIAEDEADIRAIEYDRTVAAIAPGMFSVDHPLRLLAECEAKRRIVERLSPLLDPFSHSADRACTAEVDLAWDVLASLALPYADHPDMRPEWRL